MFTIRQMRNTAGEPTLITDKSENFLLKGVYDHSDTLSFDGQIMYSPYTSHRELTNRHNNYIDSKSTGLEGYLAAHGVSGETDWNTKVSFMHNDSSRESPDDMFRWTGSTAGWCSSS